MAKGKLNIFDFVTIIIGLAIFTFAAYKSIFASFTHDEAFTYNNIVGGSFMDIVSYKFTTANNHMLNSVLMKWTEFVFGNSEWSLRLPNTLGHFLYLIFSFKLLKRLNVSFLILPFFVLLNVNPYLLDFFSLARGYGLSIGLLMSSIYYFYLYIEQGGIINYKYALVFMTLSVFSSFVIIYVFIGLVASYNLIEFLKEGRPYFKLKKIIKANTFSFISIGIVLLVLFEPVRKLTEAKQLYFGGETSFLHDTIGFLIGALLHYGNYSNSVNDYVFYSFFVLIITASLISVTNIVRKRKLTTVSSILVLLVFVFTVFATTTFNHYLLGSKYIIQRTALFLYPIVVLCLIFVLTYFYQTKKGKYISILLTFSLAFVFVQHTVKCANSYSYFDWHYDLNSKKIMEVLALEHQTEKKATMGVHPFFAPTVNYYKAKYKLDWLSPVSRGGIDTTKYYDYIFGQIQDVENFEHYKKDLIITFEENNNYLYKRRK